MPHLRCRALKLEIVKKISTPLINGLTEIIKCDRSWFTLEHINSTFISDEEIINSYPFIEILWFDRGEGIKKEVVNFITNLLKKENDYPSITIVFIDLEKNNYFENGEHF